MMAWSRSPLVVVMSAAHSGAPDPTPIDFDALHAGDAGGQFRRQQAVFRRRDRQPRPRSSRDTRQALAVAFVKLGRGSWPYQREPGPSSTASPRPCQLQLTLSFRASYWYYPEAMTTLPLVDWNGKREGFETRKILAPPGTGRAVKLLTFILGLPLS
jgi:hypothetical protein